MCLRKQIGVDRGSSLKMWQNYFSHYHYIFGIDKDTEFQSTSDRVHIFKGDQSDVHFLVKVLSQINTQAGSAKDTDIPTGRVLDLIIDDGSHVPAHQISTFMKDVSV